MSEKIDFRGVCQIDVRGVCQIYVRGVCQIDIISVCKIDVISVCQIDGRSVCQIVVIKFVVLSYSIGPSTANYRSVFARTYASFAVSFTYIFHKK